MSRGTETGKAGSRSRILAAAVLAAVMLAVPLSASVSDATGEDASAGYVYTAGTGASDSELSSFNIDSDSLLNEVVRESAPIFSYFFDDETTSKQDVSLGTYVYSYGASKSLSDLRSDSRYLRERSFTDFTITYVFLKECKMMATGLQSKQSQAAAAVSYYFNNDYFYAGDTITFSGTFHASEIYDYVNEYAQIGDDSYLETSYSEYYVIDTDYEVKAVYTPVSSESKEVVFTADESEKTDIDYDMDYGKDVSEVKEGDPYEPDINKNVQEFDQNAAVTVNGREYSLAYDGSIEIVGGSAIIQTAEDLTIMPYIPSFESTEHISYDATYDGFMESYDTMKDELDTEKKSNVMLYVGIGAGVAAVVVVGVLAFVLLKKRK